MIMEIRGNTDAYGHGQSSLPLPECWVRLERVRVGHSTQILPQELPEHHFDCHICDKRFGSQNDLTRHMYVHKPAGERPFKCKHCGKGFVRADLRRKHVVSVHKKLRALKCSFPDCDMKFSLQSYKRAHELKMHDPSRTQEDRRKYWKPCPICKMQVGNLKSHLNVHTGDKPYKCSYPGCDKGFAQPGAQRTHEQTFHATGSAKQVHKCEYEQCGKIFNSRHGQLLHEKIHTNKEHHCEFCGKSFTHASQLLQHSRRHTGEKQFKCNHAGCTSTFTTTNQARAHEKSVHATEKQYKCRYCEATFRKEGGRWTHERLLHKKIGYPCKFCDRLCACPSAQTAHERRHDGSSERLHVCPFCPKTFLDKYALQEHSRTHTGEKPYKCDECSKKFTTSTNLTTHKRVHSDLKPYACAKCGREFRNLATKKKHDLIHAESKNLPFECEFCDKKYREAEALKVHMRSHTGEKPYKCPLCPAAFSRSGDCGAHQRTHTGEKPYKCQLCGAAFASSGHLRRHERSHTGERPHKCKLCPQTFREAGDCDKHERRHTGEKLYKCAQCGKAFVTTTERNTHERRIHNK